MWARFLITSLLCVAASVVVLSGRPALADPAVLLDDHFDGSELNTSLWSASGGTFGVSGSRLTITPSGSGFAILQGGGHKYSRVRFEDVRVHQMGHDFFFDFGYTGALSAYLSLWVDNAGTLRVGAWQGGPNISWGQSLGAFENATYEIVWWKDYLAVLKNDVNIFTLTDPARIPTYEAMGLGARVRDGVVSFDRVTMTEIVPEPATLASALLGMGALIALGRRRRKHG
jgi:hypothetical protein